jgi:hypothetical protein
VGGGPGGLAPSHQASLLFVGFRPLTPLGSPPVPAQGLVSLGVVGPMVAVPGTASAAASKAGNTPIQGQLATLHTLSACSAPQLEQIAEGRIVNDNPR